MNHLRFHEMPDGRQIAFRLARGAGPALVFLPGYMSDMAGGKANAVFDWARNHGRACLLLDYSGCGESPGDFADGTLSRWQEEVLELVATQLAGLALGSRLAGLVGIAPAPDFTDWGYDDSQKAELAGGRPIFEVNPYGPEPTPTHPAFWADGQNNRLLDSDIALDCPVRLLQGQQDPDVPWHNSLMLAERLRSDDVQVVLVKDGDHRLSRDGDIALLLDIIARLPRNPA